MILESAMVLGSEVDLRFLSFGMVYVMVFFKNQDL